MTTSKCHNVRQLTHTTIISVNHKNLQKNYTGSKILSSATNNRLVAETQNAYATDLHVTNLCAMQEFKPEYTFFNLARPKNFQKILTFLQCVECTKVKNFEDKV